MFAARLYLLQRASAFLMVPLVFGHLGLMIYAVRGGLSAEEILSRTRGSLFWGSYYGLFVVAASVHATIGLRTIITETLGISGIKLNLLAWLFALALLAMGVRAVVAVVA